MMKELLRALAYWCYRCLPKFNYVVVYGWPDYEDTCLALQQHLNDTSVRKVILFVTDPNSPAPMQLAAKTKVVHKNSLRGIGYFAFARYVLFTHRCFMWKFPPNVVSVNLWHGMPMKRIGWLLPNNRGIGSRFAVATSDLWADVMQRSMGPFERTLATGLPRNDRLFSDPIRVWSRLGLPRGANPNKLVAWLPTYRQSVRGEIRQDGAESGNVFGMEGITMELLNDFLKRHNAYAFVKPHPMAPFEKASVLSNLLIVDDNWLKERGLTLYEVVGQSDVLVSDISGMVVDYLLLDRPIIHSFPDLAEYSASRGFSVEPITDYFVGPVATTAEELFAALTRALNGEDSYTAQRRRIQGLFFRDVDGHATVRLLEQLGLPAVR
jgi:CDP-glycerol glycerophosphotransferase (TagB/SpsB family)